MLFLDNLTYTITKKRFSIDHLQYSDSNPTTSTDITKIENKSKIFSDNISICIRFTPAPRTMDLDERAINTQKFFEDLG